MAFDNFTVTAGIENHADGLNNNNGNAGNDVDYYAGFNYADDWGGIQFTAAHDSGAIISRGNVNVSLAKEAGTQLINGVGAETRNGAWAYQVSANLDLSEYIPGGVLTGKYAWDDGDEVTKYVDGTAGFDADNFWQVSYQMDLSDDVELWAQYSEASNGGNNISTTDIDAGTVTDAVAAANAANEGRSWGVGINWYPISGYRDLKVFGSYSNREIEATTFDATANTVSRVNKDTDTFVVGIRRSF